MKMLMISNLYPPNAIGGYERLCFSVAEALANIGHEVGVLTSTYGAGVTTYPGQHIWRSLLLLATEGNIYEPFNISYEKRNLINENNIIVLNGVISEYQPKVIFVWNLLFLDRSFIEEIEGKYSEITVYFLTDNWMISYFNPDYLGQYFTRVVFGSDKDEDLLYEHKFKELRGRAIFGSDYMARFYSNAGLKFMNSRVIHNGVDLQPVNEQSYRDRLFTISHSSLKLLFAGRVVAEKGIETVLRALPIISQELSGVDVTLDIVGDCQDTSYKEKLQDIIRRNSSTEVVRFRDPVPQGELFNLFQDYDIYLFPSLYEPFALTLIYALHAGIPTIASDIGGNPEIIFDEKTGLLFSKNNAPDMKDKVIILYRSGVKRANISRNAKKMAWENNFNRMLANIDEFLRS